MALLQVSLLSDEEDPDGDADGSRSTPIDVEALQAILLGPTAEGRRAAKRIKVESKA